MTRPSAITPALHSAGATVIHRSPFDELSVPVSHDPLAHDLIARWIKPLYMRIPGQIADCEPVLRALAPDLTRSLVAALLENFNWRPRKVGAFFVALTRDPAFEDQIARLLLRSDVCFAAYGYCLALARLNSPRAVEALREYLDYYLTRADLWFDQHVALAALHCLDTRNGTSDAAEYSDRWRTFVQNKPHWNLDDSCELFTAHLAAVDALASLHPYELG